MKIVEEFNDLRGDSSLLSPSSGNKEVCSSHKKEIDRFCKACMKTMCSVCICKHSHEEKHRDAQKVFACDGCDEFPIVEIRMHCNVCPDFDYCLHCYKTQCHSTTDHSLVEAPELTTLLTYHNRYYSFDCGSCGKEYQETEEAPKKCTVCPSLYFCKQCQNTCVHSGQHTFSMVVEEQSPPDNIISDLSLRDEVADVKAEYQKVEQKKAAIFKGIDTSVNYLIYGMKRAAQKLKDEIKVPK